MGASLLFPRTTRYQPATSPINYKEMDLHFSPF
jgi:hypothetical protein